MCIYKIQTLDTLFYHFRIFPTQFLSFVKHFYWKTSILQNIQAYSLYITQNIFLFFQVKITFDNYFAILAAVCSKISEYFVNIPLCHSFVSILLRKKPKISIIARQINCIFWLDIVNGFVTYTVVHLGKFIRYCVLPSIFMKLYPD